MERIESAYRAGVAEAERDIADGRPKLRYGSRGEWGEELARTLHARFGVELVALCCLVTAEMSSFEAGYNDMVGGHIDAIHGAGAVAAVLDEIQRRRQEAWEAWATEQRRANPGGATT